MHHLTLTTGHSRWSPRSEVDDRTIAIIRPVVRAGAGPLGNTGWFLQMVAGEAPGGAAFECHYGTSRGGGGLWVVSCYIAWTEAAADEMWAAAMRNPLIKAGVRRPRLPWLAAAIMPEAGLAGPELMMQAGDLERCVAWTVLDGAPVDMRESA